MLLYISPLLISAILGFFLTLFIMREQRAFGTRALVVLILAAILWSLGYAMEFLSPDLKVKLFWAKFQYFGIVTIPWAWLIYAIQYMGPLGWWARLQKYSALLAVVPVITICLVWTNEAHGLVWSQVKVLDLGPVQSLELEHGPWFWVNLVYGYGLMLTGSARLVGGLFNSVRLHYWQFGLTLIGILIPWIGNLVYISSWNPIPHLDWTPFAFIIAGMLFSISLFRYHLANILPIAKDIVFAGLSDCLLVLDIQDRLVDLNPAAQAMIGNSAKAPFGKPIAQLLPDLAQWVAKAGTEQEFRVEISQGEDPDQRFYDLRISPLSGPYPYPIGRLVVCHEITQHKKEQVLLEHARTQLEAIVLERTKELSQAVEQLQRELNQRTLAEKRFEEVVESAPDAMLLVDQSSAIILVNAQAESMFGYSRAELVGQNVETLIPEQRRATHSGNIAQFFENPRIRNINFNLDLSARRKDGSEFPVEISLGPLKTEDGFWVACAIRDISERRRTEQAQKRLLEEVRQSQKQLSALTVRLQAVQEFERRRLARELHDRVGQNLTGLNLNLQIILNQLTQAANPEVVTRLDDSIKLVEATTRQVRDVMADLHPPMLDDYGLLSALKWYSGIFSQRTGIEIQVVGSEYEPRLQQQDELALFRIVQEALNNIGKHARASQATIMVGSDEETAWLKVKDDGQGFDIQSLEAAGRYSHWGLITMQQRAVSIGGQLSVESTPDQGTQVNVNIHRGSHAD